MIQNLSPKSRLAHAQELRDQLASAKQLHKKRKNKQALAKLLWVFDNSDEGEAFDASFELMSLAETYKPAIAAIESRRNDLEALILEGKVNVSTVSSWERLNEALKEPLRSTELFLKLAAQKADEEVLAHLASQVWKQLVKEQRYECLRPFLPKIGWPLLLNVSRLDCDIWFPRRFKQSRAIARTILKRDRHALIQDGSKVYELALALGEIETARKLSRKIQTVERSDRLYSRLVKAAIRAGESSEAEAIFEEAQAKLPGRKLVQTRKAMPSKPTKSSTAKRKQTNKSPST
jgi:hypothetical protein